MSVFFSDIRDMLSPYLVHASMRDSSSAIRRVRLASNEAVLPETLYFAYADRVDPAVPYENIILLGEGKAAETLSANGKCNLIVLPQTENWTEIFNKIEDRIESGQNAFYQEILIAQRIPDILHLGERHLKRSLHLFDGALHSIKPHIYSNDSNKYMDADLSAAIAAHLKETVDPVGQEAFAVALHNVTYQCFKMIQEDLVVAFLAVPGDTLQELDSTAIKMLIFALLRKLQNLPDKPEAKGDLMYKLIDSLTNNRRMRPREVALFLRQAGWDAQDSYYFLKIVHMDYEADRLPQNVDLLVKEISARISIKHYVYQNALYLIINCNQSGMLRRADFEGMFETLLANCRATAGFSNLCKGFEYLFMCGFQPDVCLYFGKLINPAYVTQPYSFYFHYEILLMLSAHTDMSKYIHPIIRLLDEYDRANNSDLVMTVYAYLNDDRKIQRAANHLKIHKNSMAYRLEKIHALTDFDLNTEYRTTHMRISCSIVKLQRIFRQKHLAVPHDSTESDT